jgi:hypothetical protein
MTPATLLTAVLARIADVQGLAEATGLAIALAGDLDARKLQAMLADLTVAEERLNAVLAHFEDEGDQVANEGDDRRQ